MSFEYSENELVQNSAIELLRDTLKWRTFYAYNDVYSNDPKIRNLYAHGIEYLNDNENEHYTNYVILLRLMVLLMIKTNDEFCLINAEYE